MQALYGLIADRGYSPGLQQWLGSNLVPARNGDGLVWSFDVGGEALALLSLDYLQTLGKRLPRMGGGREIMRMYIWEAGSIVSCQHPEPSPCGRVGFHISDMHCAGARCRRADG